MRLSLNGRLFLGVGALLVLLLGIAGLSASLMSRNQDLTDTLATVEVPVLESSQAMDAALRLEVGLADAYGKLADEEVLANLMAARKAFRDAREAYELLEEPDQIKAVYDVLHTWYDQIVSLEDSLIRDSQRRASVGAKDLPAVEADVERHDQAMEAMLADFTKAFEPRVVEEVKGGMADLTAEIEGLGRFTLWAGVAASVLALALAVLVTLLLRRGLSGPLESLSGGLEAVAAGDLDRQITDGGIREFSGAAEGFNAMSRRLAEAQKSLRHQVEEQSRILDTIPIALLILGTDRKIGSVFSKDAPAVLGTDDLAGRSLSDLFYTSEADRKLLDRFLEQVFENEAVDPEMLAEINPAARLEYRGPNLGAEPQSLEVRFDRIVEEGRVAGVLVNIADRTEARLAEEALATEQKARRRDADSVEAILNHGPDQLQAFLEETREQMKSVRAGLSAPGNPEALNNCFRKLHGIKGSAASLGIESVAFLAHEAESLLAPRRNASAPADPRANLKINMTLGAIGEELDSVENLVGRLRDLLVRADQGTMDDPKASLVKGLHSMVGQLSRTLAKELVFVHEVQVDQVPAVNELKQIIIHLVRNAADHGVEDSYERIAAGKPVAGTIRLTIRPAPGDPKQVLVEVADDGAGLDYRSIEKKARALGFLAADAPAPPNNALLRYLFRPGFTTRSAANEISGRGVGLDLVKDTVDKLGGTVQVATEPGKGTRFRILVPAA